MASRGRHVGGARWFAIALLIAAALMAMPPRARADTVPIDPGALAQAGLAEAQHAVDLATAAVSAASPAVAVPAATPAPGTSVLPASARAAASPPAAAPQPAAPPAAATSGGVSRVLRPPAPPVHSARAAGPHLPVSVSAARAGADTAPPVTPAEPVVTPPVAPVRIEPVAPVPIGPVASVPMPSMPVVTAPVIGAVPTVSMPAISIPWWPVSGSIPSSGSSGITGPVWPSASIGTPWAGAMPALLSALSTTPPGPLGAVWSSGGPAHDAPAGRGTRGRRAGAARPAVHASSAHRAAQGAAPKAWPAGLGRTPRAAHVPVRLLPHPSRHGGAVPRPARPEPAGAVPPLNSPVTGGAPAVAGAAGGAGVGGVVVMATSALLLIFLLSTRVSLELSAWRSTLLSLRLERPG